MSLMFIPDSQTVVLNLSDFGGLPSSPDISVALLKALKLLPASGGTISIPAGSYTILNQVAYQMLANQCVVIEGKGNVTINSTVAEPAQESGILQFTGDAAASAHLIVRNLTISHNGAALGHVDGIFVQPLNYGHGGTQSLANIEMDNVRVSGASYCGANILGALCGIISNCAMTSNQNGGLFLIGCQALSVVGGNYSSNQQALSGYGYGIACASSGFLPYCKDILIAGAQVNNNSMEGIDAHHAHNVHIIGNTCIGNGLVGIYAVAESTSKDVGDITISDNTVDMTGAGFGGIYTAIKGIHIGSFGTTGAINPGAFIVTGNKIYGMDSVGSGNQAIRIMTPTSGVAPERVIIANNTIEHGSDANGYMIFADANLAIEHLEISSNILHAASGAYGIIIQSATDVIVADNSIRIDSGASLVNFINVVSGANANVANNQCNGAVIATPITNTSSTHTLRGNTANGAIVNDTGFTVDAKGHLISLATGVPTLSNVNANVSGQAVIGNDVRGSIIFNVVTATIAAGSALFTLVFNQAYANTNFIVILTNASNQTVSAFYVTNAQATSVIIHNAAALPVANGYAINYMIIG